MNFLIGILAIFPVGVTSWTMNNNMLLSMGQDNLKLSIKLPENPDINMIMASPYKANVIIGMRLNYCVIILQAYLFSETLKPIINLPDYMSHKIGDAVTLRCFTHGRSKINYHWERRVNSSKIWMTISAKMNTGFFLISSVTKEDEGIYRCVACDCYSCSHSVDTIAITVIGKEWYFVPLNVYIVSIVYVTVFAKTSLVRTMN